MPFQAVITQIGLNKAIDANKNGIALEITHVAAGTGGYTPLRTRTALNHEVVRVPISGGKNISATQIHLTALFDSGEFTCRELGFYLSDGTLFAVISDPVNAIFYKTLLSTPVQAFDLTLDTVPLGSITINSTGDLSLYYAEPFAQMVTASIATMTRQLHIEQRLRDGGL